MTVAILLGPAAEKDIRGLGKPERERIREALAGLRRGDPNLDVKALRGAAPWLRLRAGDWRVLYRPLTTDELAPGTATGFLVARVVNRRDLERAARKL
jgi:mRNA-degrading endonuclease RelE of RelBE toxin-antitoxin system